MDLFAFSKADNQRPSVENRDALHMVDTQTAAIIENMSDAFIALDADWTIAYVSGKAVDLLQTPLTDLVGKNLWGAFPEAVNTRFGTSYRNVLATKTPEHFEAFLPRADVWVEVNVCPSGDGLVVFFRDITARRKAVEALQDSE